MGLLGRLFGRRAPEQFAENAKCSRLAPPGTYYVDGGVFVGDPFVIRRKADDKRVGPAFTSIVEAQKYCDSLEGGPAYEYPPGVV